MTVAPTHDPHRSRRRLGLAEMGRGLGHKRRIAIIMSLLEAQDELSTTDLAELAGTSVSRIDHHVKYLSALGMIESKRSRRVRGTLQHFYLLVPAVRDVFAAIAACPLPAPGDREEITADTLPFTASRAD